jgi:MFS family permease
MGQRSGSVFALIGVVLIGMTGFGVFLPIFPFLALHIGASPTAVTISMGAYSLGQLIASPFWGRLSDKIGRKPVLVIGLVGAAISYVFISFADNVETLCFARLFGGLMAGNIGAAFAAAADLADDKTRARNMGLLGAAVGFAFIAGPALGALLIGHEPDRAGFARVCLVSAGLAALAAIAAAALFEESLPPSARRQKGVPRPRRVALLLARPALTRFVVVMFLMVAAQALLETAFGLWSDAVLHWGPRQVGWTLAALGAGAVLLQGGGAGAAARIVGERLTLFLGLALFALGLAVLAAVGDFNGMAAAMVVFGIGVALATPALNALIAAQADGHDRGAVMGLSQSAGSLGRVAGPLSSGALFDHFGPWSPFAVGAVLVLLALIVAMSEPHASSRG